MKNVYHGYLVNKKKELNNLNYLKKIVIKFFYPVVNPIISFHKG
jgi:hypothetical protein